MVANRNIALNQVKFFILPALINVSHFKNVKRAFTLKVRGLFKSIQLTIWQMCIILALDVIDRHLRIKCLF